MGLWEYTQKRMAEIGVTQRHLTEDFDISPATLQRIRQDRPIKESTKQKLALALKCSVDDIQTAISGYKGRPAVEKMPEGPEPAEEKEPPTKITQRNIKIESIAERKVDHPPLTIPRIQLHGKIIAADLKPVKQKEDKPKERWPEDPPEEQKTPPPDSLDARLYAVGALPDVFGIGKDSQIERERQEAVAEYKQKLKDIALQAMLNVPKVNLTGETPNGFAYKALMEDILKNDTGVE